MEAVESAKVVFPAATYNAWRFVIVIFVPAEGWLIICTVAARVMVRPTVLEVYVTPLNSFVPIVPVILDAPVSFITVVDVPDLKWTKGALQSDIDNKPGSIPIAPPVNNAHFLLIVAFVPASGPFAIYTFAIICPNVTFVLLAANVDFWNELIANSKLLVPLAAVLDSVNVLPVTLNCGPVILQDANVLFPPIFTLPLIPTPPDTVNAPVVLEVETVVSVIETAPLDVNPVNVPIEVILVWAAVANVPVIVPVTDKAPPTFNAPPIPTPPVTINAPVDVVVEAVEFVIDTAPLDVNPVNVPTEVILVWAAVANVPVILPVTDKAPPTFNAPPIPTPPVTIKAPVDVVVEAVEFVIETVPLDVNPVNVPTEVIEGCAAVANVPVILPVTDKAPPTFNAPPIPTPPVTIKAPVDVVVEAVEFVIETAPLEVNPVNVPTEVIEGCAAVANVPVMLPPTFNAPPIPTPPVTIKAPVDVVVEAVEFVIETAPLEVNPVNVPTEVIEGCAAVANVPVMLPPTFNAPPIPTPPVTIKAPEVVEEEAVVSFKAVTPALIHKAYALVIVIFVPAKGEFSI